MIASTSALSKEVKLTKEQIAKARWNKLHSLIIKEMNTIDRAKRKTLKLQYRKFELMSEKIKLYKQIENKKFMALKLKQGNKVNRKEVFKKTLSLYNQAHKYGKNLIKKYPNSKYKPAIYYTLALNSRDYAYDKKELGYLRKAIKLSSNASNVNYLARTSLAEYYYNNKKWKQALYQYNKVLKNQDDEWFTKNLLNSGWCHLKTQNFAQAIDNLEKSHTLSKDEYYVDVTDQAMTGLISFYVYGKQIERGINFIEKNAVKERKHESLLKLAQKSSGKGYYTEAQKIIDILEDQISTKSHPEVFADLRLFEFDFYKQFHKPKKLLKVAKSFEIITLSEYQKEEAIRKISEIVGTKQVILKKDFSKYDMVYDQEELNQIIAYFNILANINSVEKAQYEFFKAETYFSIHLFQEAFNEYKNTLETYDKSKSKNDLRAKSLDAIFAAIENIKYNSIKEKDNDLKYSFKKYLSYWPNDNKAQKIYPRLFAIYLKEKNHELIASTLDSYIKNFKKDNKDQKILFKSHMDLLIKDKNTELLANKITKMQKGYLSFSKDEIKKSESILANILFNNFQKLNKEGNTEAALAGYKKVHFTNFYPRSIKADAAFNMGMIYTDLSDNHNAMKWYKRSFEFYTKQEVNKKRVFLEKMATRTALLHNFLNASKLNKFILDNFCHEKKKNIPVFENAIRYDLANDYILKTMYTIKKHKKCVPAVSKTLKKDILIHLFQYKHESYFLRYINGYKLEAVFPELISEYYERFFWKFYNKDPSKANLYETKLKRMKTKKSELLFTSMKKYKKLEKSIDLFLKNKLEFPKKVTNPEKSISQVNKRVASIGEIVNKANTILKLGHGQISVMVFDSLTKLTREFSKEISNYHVPFPDPEFQKGFKQFIGQYIAQIQSEYKNNIKKSQQLVEKFDLLVEQRNDSHMANSILTITDIRPLPSKTAITFGLGK